MKVEFFNRELSWIEFNARVLNQALRKDIPLMERLQFLAIVTSNFDEFFQVRVASVKRALYENPDILDVSGLSPKLCLKSISARAHQLIQEQHDCLIKDILPELKEKGLEYVSPEFYTQQQRLYVQNIFKNSIYPLLTPLRTDTEKLPNIKNLSVYAGFLLKPMEGIRYVGGTEDFRGKDDENRIAFVEIPSAVPQVYWLPTERREQKQFAYIEDIITMFGTNLFPGFTVKDSMIFKLTRDADFAVDEDSGNNFIHAMEDVLIQRKSSFPVQMTCTGSSETIFEFLKEKLELSNDDIYVVDSFVNPNGLLEIRSEDDSGNLSYEAWEHFYPADLPEEEPYWDTLKLRDKILHVPYESYDPVVKFISDAADDPDVLAIKMTLYRTGRDSPIVYALERAAQQGKQVVVLVELKARFDEERNIAWANELEQAGVTVIYGLVNLKVHAKILMVVRRENDTIGRYVHLSTGNYNPKTAKLYSDLSLFTANAEIANDATNFFNLVTGYSTLQKMNHLGMAPVNLKEKILNMIQREIDRSSPENPGLIMAKMNSLTHEEVIAALYKASQAGVKILLNIRGICMLVPGLSGLSENIKVVSIVDRYLEHSRIFYFQNAGTPELYCSSADWMSRNLDRRIELMFPILDKNVFAEVKNILDTYFEDSSNAEMLLSDGSWKKISPEKKMEAVNAQTVLFRKYKHYEEKKLKNPEMEFKVRRK